MATRKRHFKDFPNPNKRVLEDLYYQADWYYWKSETVKEASKSLWRAKLRSYLRKEKLQDKYGVLNK